MQASIARVTRLAMLASPLNYFIIYDSSDDLEPVSNVVSSLQVGIANALPGLFFALQLPRHRQDATDASFEDLVEAQRLEQRARFHLLTFDRFDEASVARLAGDDRTLIIGPPERQADLAELSSAMRFLIPPIDWANLSDRLLRKTWDDVAAASAPGEVRRKAHHVLAEFDSAPTDIPNGFIRYQLHDRPITLGQRTPRERVEETLEIRTFLLAMAQLEKEGATVESADLDLPDRLRREQQGVRLPLALGVPGVSAREVREVAKRENVGVPELRGLDRRSDPERNAVALITASAAARRTGMGVVLDGIPAAAFVALSNLESHWASGARPSKVKLLMRKLNEAAAPIWTDAVKLAVARASDVVTFSNFPLGLLTFPGDSAPLAYRLPVTHRPLSSLSVAVKYEFAPTRRADFSSGFSVLVVECISALDRVGRSSRQGWDSVEMMLQESPANIAFTRTDAETPADLDALIGIHNPDILVISAHGAVKDGVAGIVVGGEFYAADRRRNWPAVVILSACRVAPRGAGGPNIADRILEQGAIAVLAPEIDVDVRHNALLILRLFLYMALAVEGKEAEEDLLGVWHRVQGSSPIADIMHAPGVLGRWMAGNGVDKPPYVRFMNESAHSLRKMHVFEDTEKFLVKLAAETGEEAKLKQLLAAPGYLPESVFYSMAGFPEKVTLKRRPVFSVV